MGWKEHIIKLCRMRRKHGLCKHCCCYASWIIHALNQPPVVYCCLGTSLLWVNIAREGRKQQTLQHTLIQCLLHWNHTCKINSYGDSGRGGWWASKSSLWKYQFDWIHFSCLLYVIQIKYLFCTVDIIELYFENPNHILYIMHYIKMILNEGFFIQIVCEQDLITLNFWNKKESKKRQCGGKVNDDEKYRSKPKD